MVSAEEDREAVERPLQPRSRRRLPSDCALCCPPSLWLFLLHSNPQLLLIQEQKAKGRRGGEGSSTCTGLGPEDPVNHVSNFNAYRSRRGPMVPPQSFIPQHLPEISATAEFSETPCGGRPVPRKTGGSLQNRLVVDLEFFRVHFWSLWCLRSTAFSPGSLLGDLPCQNLP